MATSMNSPADSLLARLILSDAVHIMSMLFSSESQDGNPIGEMLVYRAW